MTVDTADRYDKEESLKSLGRQVAYLLNGAIETLNTMQEIEESQARYDLARQLAMYVSKLRKGEL